jgi:hypothetical protein
MLNLRSTPLRHYFRLKGRLFVQLRSIVPCTFRAKKKSGKTLKCQGLTFNRMFIYISNCYLQLQKDQKMAAINSRLRLKCDGTRAETRFRLSGETDESI